MQKQQAVLFVSKMVCFIQLKRGTNMQSEMPILWAKCLKTPTELKHGEIKANM